VVIRAEQQSRNTKGKVAMSLHIGAASLVITPPLGTQIQGAGIPDQPACRVRDDLEANALLLHSGSESVLLVSCDLAGLPTDYVADVRAHMAEAAGVPERSVIIACTHTHSGPSIQKTNYKKPVAHAYMDDLRGRLIELAGAAAETMQPGMVGWGLGEARLGYNRRCCWADGSHTMYNPGKRTDFTGLEGPDDPAHLALFACDSTGNPLAVLYNNTTHPTAFYGRDLFSADFVGEARIRLRQALGEIPVLFLNGAQGDICRSIATPGRGRVLSGEQHVLAKGQLAAGETIRLFQEATARGEIHLGHCYDDLTLPVQLPDPERVAWGRSVLERIDAGEDIRGMESILAWGAVSLQQEFGDRPTDTVSIHALRIGDVALVTQPFELYCQFGLDIKRRSPAPVTGVCSLADGRAGYCPTIYGILGGGYSGEPIQWRRFAPEAGYRVVDTACRLLYELWAQN
jgi:hypothetical protein